MININSGIGEIFGISESAKDSQSTQIDYEIPLISPANLQRGLKCSAYLKPYRAPRAKAINIGYAEFIKSSPGNFPPGKSPGNMSRPYE